ncbi:MAG: FHA domain-containing protein [Clostridia bacterium]|nr:FHA domain-containing protein [Clostridia bacterium]
MYSYNNYSYIEEDILYAIGEAAIAVMLVLLVVLILMIIAQCKIFRKAGHSAGKVFIPIYSNYILYKIADKPTLFFISLGCSLGMFLVKHIPALVTIIGITNIVVHIIFCVSLSRSFNKSGGFTAGLLLLYPIFFMILGFGSSQHVSADDSNPYAPGNHYDAKQPTPQNGGYQQQATPPQRNNEPAQEPRYLLGECGALTGRRIPLNGKLLIGTNPDYCDIIYPRGTPGVSGRHCTIRYENGIVTVVDENSTYGTWIDNQRLNPGESYLFHRGHHLSLGSSRETLMLRS